MLHSMTIRLIHVHQLETLYLCYGVKGQPGVIWGHRGQKVIFTKNATSTDYMAWLCNSCIYIHKLETLYSIHGVKVKLGSLPPANIMRLCPDLFPDLVFVVLIWCNEHFRAGLCTGYMFIIRPTDITWGLSILAVGYVYAGFRLACRSPLFRVIIACCFRVAALSGNAALALSPSGNRSRVE